MFGKNKAATKTKTIFMQFCSFFIYVCSIYWGSENFLFYKIAKTAQKHYFHNGEHIPPVTTQTKCKSPPSSYGPARD